ncbi:MAG: ThuA domain-containing protein [Gemmataceae bacterium]
MTHERNRISLTALSWTLLAVVAIGAGTAAARADDQKADPAAPLKIHIISGAGEYKSEPSLRAFKEYLEHHYQVSCTASWGRDGINRLDNLEQLPSADVLLIFARRMKLDEDQMKLIRRHWEQGKPIVGIRTASHAFQKEDNDFFDRKVLGNHYQGHYGNEPVKVTPVEKMKGHPVLAGVESFTSQKLYKTGPLAEDTIVLQIGDIGKAHHPVTMVHTHNGGRMFYTSLGVPEDFQDANFRRLLTNAIFWTTRRDGKKLQR